MDIVQDTTVVHEGKAGTLEWSSGHVAEDFRWRKHVDMRYHHVMEEVRDNIIVLRNVSTC